MKALARLLLFVIAPLLIVTSPALAAPSGGIGPGQVNFDARVCGPLSILENSLRQEARYRSGVGKWFAFRMTKQIGHRNSYAPESNEYLALASSIARSEEKISENELLARTSRRHADKAAAGLRGQGCPAAAYLPLNVILDQGSSQICRKIERRSAKIESQAYRSARLMVESAKQIVESFDDASDLSPLSARYRDLMIRGTRAISGAAEGETRFNRLERVAEMLSGEANRRGCPISL